MTDAFSWMAADKAVPDTKAHQLRLRDRLGDYDSGLGPFVFHDDGHWYRVHPPTKIAPQVIAYLPLE